MTIDQVLRLEKLERAVETLRMALVDQARMLHAANDALKEVGHGRRGPDHDGGN